MKKLITLFTLSIVTIYSFAQITVTNADMPAVNDTFRLSTTINALGLDPVLTGANFSWDFSTLVPDEQRVDTFFSVSSTPALYQFYFNNAFLYPNYDASYAKRGLEISVPQVTVSDVFNYIKNTSSAFDNVGFGANINGLPASVQNDPIDKEYIFPMNYNNNNISLSEFEITVPGLGHYGQDVERIDTVDGWGSLLLPNGNYNVLRVKSILHKIDTIYVDQFLTGFTTPRPEEIEYKWLAAGTGIPVLKIITNAGAVTQIEYQDDFFDFPILTAVEEVNKINNVTVFPNPAKHHLVIDFKANVNGNLKINLKDVLGKNVGVIYNKSITSGSNKVLINLMQYNIKPGIYFTEFMVDGKQYYSEKIVVVE